MKNISKVLVTTVFTAVFAVLLGASPVLAASYTGAATPLDASDVPVVVTPPNILTITAPVGDWTSVDSSYITNQDVDVAGYRVPQIMGSGVCDEAPVTALNINIVSTSVVLGGTVTSQDHVGAGVSVANMDSPFTRPTVSSISSGTFGNGSFALVLDPDSGTTVVDRGLIHAWWTTTPTPMPGPIQFDIDTTGMTVGEYNNLAVRVTHDLNSGAEGLAQSITTSQPTVTVEYDTTICNQSSSTTDNSTDSNAPTLAATGDNANIVGLLGLVLVVIASTYLVIRPKHSLGP